MGTVFRARDIDSGRAVALKLMANGAELDPQRLDRFRGEGRVQASLDHPHVVAVYDAGESDHGPTPNRANVGGSPYMNGTCSPKTLASSSAVPRTSRTTR
jgi:serine/threonine protein kinase